MLLVGNVWYYNYVCDDKSSIFVRFSLLVSSLLSNKLIAKWFVWLYSLWRCCKLDLCITSFIVNVCKSLCRVAFVTYHGAFVMILSNLDWNRWMILMFDELAVPQSSIPYLQMGFIILLYNNSLLSIERQDRLPITQYSSLNLLPSRSLVFQMWVFHVSLRSRWIPKYLALSSRGIGVSLKRTGGQVS